MRKLTTHHRAAIRSALCKVNSISATCRIVGAYKVMVLQLLADVAQFCANYHEVFVRVHKLVQMDEL